MYSEENISVVHQFFGVSGDTATLFLFDPPRAATIVLYIFITH